MEFIDKLGFIHIKNRKLLGVRGHGKTLFYTPGGKREGVESDAEALCREVTEELTVTLVPESIRHLETFQAQADGKPEGTMVRITCYTANFTGELAPASEIAELSWFTSADMATQTPTGKLILAWLHAQGLID